MTSTTKTNGTVGATGPVVATVLSGAPDGIIRVFTAPRDDSSDARKVARSAAQKFHGFGSIGATPVPVAAKFNGAPGYAWDFSPVSKSRRDDAARPTTGKTTTATAAGPVSAEVVAGIAAVLGISREAAEVIVRESGAAVAAETKTATGKGKTGKGKKGKTATGKTDVPFLGAAAKRDAATCKTCSDYGVVRRAGARAGGAYKTQNGADTARANGNAVPCPTHVAVKGGKRKTA